MSLTFDVYGRPAPQGSKRYIGGSAKQGGRFIEASKYLPAWRKEITTAALAIMQDEGWETVTDTAHQLVQVRRFDGPRAFLSGDCGRAFNVESHLKMHRIRDSLPVLILHDCECCSSYLFAPCREILARLDEPATLSPVTPHIAFRALWSRSTVNIKS